MHISLCKFTGSINFIPKLQSVNQLVLDPLGRKNAMVKIRHAGKTKTNITIIAFIKKLAGLTSPLTVISSAISIAEREARVTNRNIVTINQGIVIRVLTTVPFSLRTLPFSLLIIPHQSNRCLESVNSLPETAPKC